MKSIRIYFLLLALPFMSCAKLTSDIFGMQNGDGKITVDTRHPGDFNSVDLEGAYDVTIIQGPQSEIRIETDSNLIKNITSSIKDGKLTISSEGFLRPTKSIFVTITSPNYRAINIEGASDLKGSTPVTSDDLSLLLAGSGSFNLEVHTQRLKSQIDGSGDIKLSGDTRSLTAGINGSGDIAAGKLTADSTTIEVAGSGDASVNVSTRLEASITGSGDVHYRGDVKDVHSRIIGSGSVDRAEK